jgi:transposase
VDGLEHQKEKRTRHYAGLDVSLEETSVCILDETGTICREIKVASHPEDLLHVLQAPVWNFERIGLEAGLLSQWLFNGLAEAVPHRRAIVAAGEKWGGGATPAALSVIG